MSNFIPSLVIGIGNIGKSVTAQVSEYITCADSRLSCGIRCLNVDTSPPPKSADATRAWEEHSVDDISTPAFYWFDDIETYTISSPVFSRLPFDPEATISLDFRDSRIAFQHFLNEHCGKLLDTDTEDSLKKIGITSTGIKSIRIVLVAEMSDIDSCVLLTDTLEELAQLNDHENWQIHMINFLEARNEPHKSCSVDNFKDFVEKLLVNFDEKFSFIRCYPFTNQLDNHTVITDKEDLISMASFFIALNLVNSEEDGSPFLALEDPSTRTAITGDPTYCCAIGMKAAYVPLYEMKRRLAFLFGYDILAQSLCAKDLTGSTDTLSTIRSESVFNRLKERYLIEQITTGIPFLLKWNDETKTLQNIEVPDKEFRETIKDAPIEEWVNLVNAYDVILIEKIRRWETAIYENRIIAVEKNIGDGDQSLTHAINQLLISKSQPLLASRLFLYEIEKEISDANNPFRKRALSTPTDSKEEIKQLQDVINNFPTLLSYQIRVFLFSFIVAVFLLAILKFSSIAWVIAYISFAVVLLCGVLYWTSQVAKLQHALKDSIDKINENCNIHILQCLQGHLQQINTSINTFVINDRKQLAVIESLADKISENYKIKNAADFKVSGGAFLSSVVNKEHLPELYAETELILKIPDYSSKFIETRILEGWRTFIDDDDHLLELRKSLWRYITPLWQPYNLPGGVRKFVNLGELQKLIIDMSPVHTSVIYIFTTLATKVKYLCSDGSKEPGITAAASALGTDFHLAGISFAVGIITICDNIVPKVLEEPEVIEE